VDLGRVAREGELQREGEWVQDVARAPRGVVGEAGGGLQPPRRQAARNCADGGEAEREAGG